jgi:16S rRNA (guanine527-N7)-methyltransferase
VERSPLTWDALPELFPGIGEPGEWLPLLQRHAALLEAAAPRVKVTTVSPEEAVRRHFAESLEILRIIRERETAGPLCDVGSGGGFPGLVIAAAEPHLEVHLVEPLQKRARLLAEMAETLGLTKVTVHAIRAEDAGRGPLRERFAIVTARAVATLPELLEYVAPLAQPGGLLALAKGSGIAEELPAAETAIAELALGEAETERMRPDVSELVTVLLFRKLGTTPARYPRRAGMPGRKPIGGHNI